MSDVDSRRRWAYLMIQRCTTPPPSYGSVEWLALPEGSPAKVAAVIIAAEAWASTGDELEAEMRIELDLAWRAHKAAEDAEYLARAQAHRDEWSHLGRRGVPSGRAFADAPEFRGEAS